MTGIALLSLGPCCTCAPGPRGHISEERRAFVDSTGLVDDVVAAGDGVLEEIIDLTEGRGCSVTVDGSGSAAGRSLALDAAAEWGRVSLLGEGGRLETEVSDTMLHKQLTVHASWVTSLQGMEDLTWLLARESLHPEVVVSHRYGLGEADEAYRQAAGGAAGKVVLLPGG